jgi:selenocysteine lyase/cysteine desulfurase
MANVVVGAAWRRRPGYLDTATYGLPPTRTVELSHRVIDDWADGTAPWRTWNDAADEARRLFAELVAVDPAAVAVGSAASTFIGLIAASLPDDAEVLVPAGEFTSLSFPLFVQVERGVTVREVPLEALADSVAASTTVVAWSAVQSSDGRVADMAAVLDAAERVGALTVVDATQAAGWLPLPTDRIDATVCSGYKWLCCPRGTAFMAASPRVLAAVRPHYANWFAADDMHAGYYGSPLRLAADARRLDAPPAWFAWMGAVTSLQAIADVGVASIWAHDVALADALRAALGLAPAGSAIVSIAGDDVEQAVARAGIKAATRADSCRLAFHLYNDADDVAAAALALRPFVQQSS